MSALEDEILAKIRVLNEQDKRRVLAFAEQLGQRPAPDMQPVGDWLAEIRRVRAEITAKYGSFAAGEVLNWLHEAREERDDALLAPR